jgi:hypothetical protein
VVIAVYLNAAAKWWEERSNQRDELGVFIIPMGYNTTGEVSRLDDEGDNLIKILFQ